MILNDIQLKQIFGDMGMMESFVPSKVKAGFSYGLNSYGYDLRLSPDDFYIMGSSVDNVDMVYSDTELQIIDPKHFDKSLMHKAVLHESPQGRYFIIPPLSSALGVAVEKISMPPNVTGLCFGKSSYARSNMAVYVTPIEAGWSGYLTLEMSNLNHLPIKVYANEGICQVVFFSGEPPANTYAGGKYQNQGNQVTFTKVI